MYGFTSCSLKKETVLPFIWENKFSGLQKVLFHFHWNYRHGHYYLNSGGFDHEEEVLLCDGIDVKVNSVTEIKDCKERILYTLICLQS